MSKKQFWTRFSIYVLFGAVIPIIFLSWRFKLFEKVEKVSEISIGGWGFVAIILLFLFFTNMLKTIKKGMPINFFTHVIECVIKVSLPLLLIFISIFLLKDFVTELYQVIGLLFVCETVSSISNPLPEWNHQHGIEMTENRLKNLFSSLLGGRGKND